MPAKRAERGAPDCLFAGAGTFGAEAAREKVRQLRQQRQCHQRGDAECADTVENTCASGENHPASISGVPGSSGRILPAKPAAISTMASSHRSADSSMVPEVNSGFTLAAAAGAGKARTIRNTVCNEIVTSLVSLLKAGLYGQAADQVEFRIRLPPCRTQLERGRVEIPAQRRAAGAVGFHFSQSRAISWNFERVSIAVNFAHCKTAAEQVRFGTHWPKPGA